MKRLFNILLLFGVAAGLVPALHPRAARAAAPEVRQTGLDRFADKLHVSFGLQDLLSPVDRQRLTSGLTTRILVQITLHREGEKQPVAEAFQKIEVRYEIWDEHFEVQIATGAGTSRPVISRNADEVARLATSVWRLPIVDLRLLRPGERYFVAVSSDLNPISEEVQAEARGWIGRSPGGARRMGPGGSFFGSLINLFINPRIEDSDRRLTFVSQTFVEPP